MIKGLIFDFDGTLVNSVRVHFECYCEVLKPFGINLTMKEYKKFSGRTVREFLEHIKRKYDREFAIEDIYLKKKQLFQFKIDHIELFPSMKEILYHSFGRFKMSIASVSSE